MTTERETSGTQATDRCPVLSRGAGPIVTAKPSNLCCSRSSGKSKRTSAQDMLNRRYEKKSTIKRSSQAQGASYRSSTASFITLKSSPSRASRTASKKPKSVPRILARKTASNRRLRPVYHYARLYCERRYALAGHADSRIANDRRGRYGLGRDAGGCTLRREGIRGSSQGRKSPCVCAVGSGAESLNTELLAYAQFI
jgi:hypothetical protein